LLSGDESKFKFQKSVESMASNLHTLAGRKMENQVAEALEQLHSGDELLQHWHHVEGLAFEANTIPEVLCFNQRPAVIQALKNTFPFPDEHFCGYTMVLIDAYQCASGREILTPPEALAALLIAAKVEQGKLKIEKMGVGSGMEAMIKSAESHILKTIKWRVAVPSVFDFAVTYLARIVSYTGCVVTGQTIMQKIQPCVARMSILLIETVPATSMVLPSALAAVAFVIGLADAKLLDMHEFCPDCDAHLWCHSLQLMDYPCLHFEKSTQLPIYNVAKAIKMDVGTIWKHMLTVLSLLQALREMRMQRLNDLLMQGNPFQYSLVPEQFGGIAGA
jgi:hypothetical protein